MTTLNFRSTKAFTLTEVLIATSLFTVAAVIAATVLVDVVQLQKKSSIQNSVYEDTRILMQQLTNEIQRGTIDYEEYYSQNIIQRVKNPGGGPYYGINYGVYASRFFYPGKSKYHLGTKNPDDLGIECSYPPDLTKECEIFYTDSSDLNTGQNPYKDSDGLNAPVDASALCDKDLGVSCNGVSNVVPELYLIDSSGTHKTILALKNMTNGVCGTGENAADCAIGMIKMTGHDFDQNGLIDVFGCDEDYNKCFQDDGVNKIFGAYQYPFIFAKGPDAGQKYLVDNKISLPQQSDLAIPFDVKASQFVPITPSRITVKSLNFTLNPVEDPYKAYAESAVQTQPTITITMTIGLSSTAKPDYPGEFPDLTIQTTVAAGVLGKIDSYPPVNDVIREDGKTSWIYKIFNP